MSPDASAPDGTTPDGAPPVSPPPVSPQVFPSAVSRWLLGFLAVSLGVPMGLAWWDGVWPAVAILGTTALGVGWMLFTTRYIFAPPHLIIRSGWFRLTLRTDEITQVRPSTSLLSSPAAGFDRLELRYGRRQSVLISPRDKAGFLERLARENPGVALPAAAPREIGDRR